MLGAVADEIAVKVFSQTAEARAGEMTTGALTVESLKAAGATGTLLNHSERRLSASEISKLVTQLRGASMELCLCSKDPTEAARLSRLSPDYLAIEPPELIGTGVAVSKAKPQVVSGTVESARRAGYQGKILCGAGIVTGEDVKSAVRLGADGVLVSSSVVKAGDWRSRLMELAGSLI
ncbi:MAG TPA: triose-phosphate isomerase [Nitrososphaerales archaeon]|nr:triose-phosphate isomerase [Nitrososphaerales archaeon]